MKIIPTKRRIHYNHECRNTCGALVSREGTLCRACYLKQVKTNANKFTKDKTGTHRLFPCANKCGAMIRRNGGLCKECYDKMRLKEGEKRQADKDKRHKEWVEKTMQRMKPTKTEICPKSPTQRHYEIIDTATNIGKCKYCGRKKDYNKLQQRYIDRVLNRELR